jgi:hypothetical protein
MFLACFILAQKPRVWQTSESGKGNACSGSLHTINYIGDPVTVQTLQDRRTPVTPMTMLGSDPPLGHVSFRVGAHKHELQLEGGKFRRRAEEHCSAAQCNLFYGGMGKNAPICILSQ